MSLVIELWLHFVKISIERSDRVLQVNNLLILRQKITFIIGDVVLENSLVGHFTLLVLVGRLKTLNQLLLVVVKVLNKRLEALYLLCKGWVLLSLFTKLLLADSEVCALSLALTLEGSNLLLKVVNFNVLLISLVLHLDRGSLSSMYLLVESLNLFAPFFDFSFESGAIDLNRLKFAVASSDLRVFQC